MREPPAAPDGAEGLVRSRYLSDTGIHAVGNLPKGRNARPSRRRAAEYGSMLVGEFGGPAQPGGRFLDRVQALLFGRHEPRQTHCLTPERTAHAVRRFG